MPGHNGLFARQLAIACSYFEYTDVRGFGQRDSGDVGVLALGDTGDPPTQSIISVLGLRDDGPGTLYEHRSQVDLTTLADAQQALLREVQRREAVAVAGQLHCCRRAS